MHEDKMEAGLKNTNGRVQHATVLLSILVPKVVMIPEFFDEASQV